MSSRVRGLCVGLAIALAAGCQRDAEAPPAPAVENPEPTTAPESPAERPPEPKAHGPRADACTALGPDGQPVAEQSELRLDSPLTLQAEKTCRLTYAADRVVTVMGPARVRVSPRSEAALLLREGALELDFAPGAARPGAAFWVATPSARIELSQGAHVIVSSAASGASDLWVVSGLVHVFPIAASQESTVTSGHGLSVSPVGKAVPLNAKLETSEQARAFLIARDRSVQPADVPRQIALFDKAQAALAVQESTSAHIAERHARLPQGDPLAMTLQAELARQEGRVARERRAIVARADALSTWLLDPTFAQRAEVEALLGRANQSRP